MSKKQAQKIASLYADTLKNNHVSYSSIYLFGSYSQNKQNEGSDIDIMVVSKNIPDHLDFKRKLWRLTRQVDTRIEPHACDWKDFKDNFSPLAKIIKKSGIKVN